MKQRLRHAVTVAKVLAQKLDDQKEVLRKKNFHLLHLTEQVNELKRNPRGCPGPTPAQEKEDREKEWARQARQEREHEKWVQQEERRKVADEHQHDVYLAIKKLEDWDASRRAEARRRRPVSEKEQKAKRDLFARALAIAEAKGRPMYVSDLRAAMEMK